MHKIAVLAIDGVNAFDLATPVEVFSRVRLPDGSSPYQVRVCGPDEMVSAGHFKLVVEHRMHVLAQADTILIPGNHDRSVVLPPDECGVIVQAAERGARVASICSGTLILAQTGLLDGRRATTHWMAAALLADRHPRVTVDPDVLYVDDGRVLSSAGAAACLDLCLHMIRSDHGAAVAAQTARVCLMPLTREGGQAQFITRDVPRDESALWAEMLQWMSVNSARPLTLNDLAEHTRMSPRSFLRNFRAQTGMTPLNWLQHARVRRAQELLETSSLPIEQVAAHAGFGSATAFREQFRRVTGTTPRNYRKAFTPADDPEPS